MRRLVVTCLIAALLLSGCAEQRHATWQFWHPNRTDEDGQRFPRWVRYDDFEDRHPYLTTTGWVVLITAIVLGAVTIWVLASVAESYDGHFP